MTEQNKTKEPGYYDDEEDDNNPNMSDEEDVEDDLDVDGKDDVDEEEDIVDEEEDNVDEEEDIVDEDEDVDEDVDEDEDNIISKKKQSHTSVINIPHQVPINVGNIYIDDDDDSDADNDGDDYLKKFDKDTQDNYIMNFHPENKLHNYDEILTMCRVFRNPDGSLDDLHKTVPFLTKFEKTRILGQRAKQINSGAQPFINIPEGIIDGYLVAKMELEQKKIPFIIKRPLPNGGSEYWKLADLEDIIF